MLSYVQLFGTPWTVAHLAPLSMEFSRQEYWSRMPFPTPGDLLTQKSNSGLLHLPHWQADSLPLCHLRSWTRGILFHISAICRRRQYQTLETHVCMDMLNWGPVVRQKQGYTAFALCPSNLNKWASILQKIKCNGITVSCHTSSAIPPFNSSNISNSTVLIAQILWKNY